MDPESVFRQLERGTSLLTATQRLARAWRRRYDAWQRTRGEPAWPSADVLPLSAWLRRLSEAWLDAAALQPGPGPAGAPERAPVWLSPAQERVVWERIVAGSPLGGGHLRSASLAAMAQEAYRRLAEWRLEVPAPAATDPLEWRAFADWARAFGERCATEGWADPARQADKLTEVMAAGALALPERVLLAGFDLLTPQARTLLEAVQAAGCDVEHLPPPRHDAAPTRRALPDAEAEAWAAAGWARERLEAEPSARIGIVVPELPAQRSLWERVLADVLHPAAVLPGTDSGSRAFNLSQGEPLAEHPAVAAALRLLRLTAAPQPLEDWSALLRSPFVAGAERERDARSLLDVRLRRRGTAELSPAALQGWAEGGGTKDAPAPGLAEALRRWRAAEQSQPRRQAAGAWALAFGALLAAWGWPGERPLDSGEYQAVQAWNELLEELARLELVVPALTRAEALSALRRMARERTFQPESPDAPVQVLGVLESGGLEFDHLWVAGLHEDAWPPPARPTPLLPAELQRRHDLPRASAARELEVARAETERLSHAAPEVVFSYPRRQEDRELRPSTLIRAFPEAAGGPADTDAPAAPVWSPLRLALGAGPALEPLADAVAPPIAAGQEVTGGTALFADQAACPFRAFARHRLRAAAPEVPEPGLDARQRGSLVHDALDALWERLGDLDALHALDDAARARTLADSAEAGIAKWMEQNGRLTPRQAELESARLRALLEGWLAVEAQRGAFQVAAREEERTLAVGGISVRGRVDRLDRLPDGRHVLIDYKTGETRPDAWWGPRPDEPQLPLYAVTSEHPLAGVAFAQVAPARRRAARFRGVAEAEAGLPGVTEPARLRLPGGDPAPASLDEALARWRAALEGLAARFLAGAAEVDPKRADTCRYCELPGLCRIAELRPTAWGEDAAEDAGEGGEGNHG